MIFGPLSENQITQLVAKLDQFKAHYTLKDSNIEVADSLVPLVEEELVRIGVLEPLSEEELDHEEYLCAKCDYISTSAGSCPTHGGALLDYSAWVASQRKSGESNIIGIIFAVAIIAAVLAAFSLK